jgi:hypothetical protein
MLGKLDTIELILQWLGVIADLETLAYAVFYAVKAHTPHAGDPIGAASKVLQVFEPQKKFGILFVNKLKEKMTPTPFNIIVLPAPHIEMCLLLYVLSDLMYSNHLRTR